MSYENDIQEYLYQFDPNSNYDSNEFFSMDNNNSTEIENDFTEFGSDLGNIIDCDQSEKTSGELKSNIFHVQ